jgi:LTXXQ motif family protein
MNRLTKILIPVVLIAVAASTIVVAQQMRRDRHSPETMQRLQDGRIAMITTALKMTEAQQKLWAPVETEIRTTQAARLKSHQERRAQREARSKMEKGTAVAPIPLPDRLDAMSTQIGERATRVKTFAVTFRPFYESLSEEQKAVVGPLMADITGRGRGEMGHMKGHRFGGGHRGPGQGPL